MFVKFCGTTSPRIRGYWEEADGEGVGVGVGDLLTLAFGVALKVISTLGCFDFLTVIEGVGEGVSELLTPIGDSLGVGESIGLGVLEGIEGIEGIEL